MSESPPKGMGHAPDKLLSNTTHDSKGKSTVDPGIGLLVRNLRVQKVALNNTVKKLPRR